MWQVSAAPTGLRRSIGTAYPALRAGLASYRPSRTVTRCCGKVWLPADSRSFPPQLATARRAAQDDKVAVGNSRFPAGMTERKARAKAGSSLRFRMTGFGFSSVSVGGAPARDHSGCISYRGVNFMHGRSGRITGKIFGNRPLKANL
jgi:hypothetical protein